MMSRNLRTLALALFLTTGLVTWSGCNTENADGTPNALGKTENKIKEESKIVGDKVKEESKIIGDKVKEDAKIVGDKVKEEAKIVGDKVKEETEKAKEKLDEMTKKPTPPPVETPK